MSCVYQQLMPSRDCLDKSSNKCSSVLDTANVKHKLEMKETLYISWLWLSLNKQKKFQNIKVTFLLVFPFFTLIFYLTFTFLPYINFIYF